MFGLLFSLLACDTSSSAYSLNCDLPAPALSPAEGSAGQAIVATGQAFTEVQDTVVSVGGSAATVTGVGREDCDTCDQCRVDEGCTSCDDCDSCATDCAPCVETVEFTVPALSPGIYPVTLTNLHGQSSAASFTVEVDTGQPEDSGATGDSGASDSGSGDSGSSDSGSSDSGAGDSGSSTP